VANEECKQVVARHGHEMLELLQDKVGALFFRVTCICCTYYFVSKMQCLHFCFFHFRISTPYAWLDVDCRHHQHKCVPKLGSANPMERMELGAVAN
jgi:hypothetical protein